MLGRWYKNVFLQWQERKKWISQFVTCCELQRHVYIYTFKCASWSSSHKSGYGKTGAAAMAKVLGLMSRLNRNDFFSFASRWSFWYVWTWTKAAKFSFLATEFRLLLAINPSNVFCTRKYLFHQIQWNEINGNKNHPVKFQVISFISKNSHIILGSPKSKNIHMLLLSEFTPQRQMLLFDLFSF